MAESLSALEKTAVEEFLAIVNAVRHDHNVGTMSYNTGVKFLMARKFELYRALALYEQHEMTRFREGLADFDLNDEPLNQELYSGKFTVLPTRDSNNSAIAMFTASRHNPIECRRQTTLQGLIVQMDVALESIETQRSGFVFIYNMMGCKYSNFDYELSQKILSLLKGSYPARLKKVLILMAPMWFKAPFKILRLFVREKLRDRVLMVNMETLADHIPAASLPCELGGKLTYSHSEWIAHCVSHKDAILGELCDLSSSHSSPRSILIAVNQQLALRAGKDHVSKLINGSSDINGIGNGHAHNGNGGDFSKQSNSDNVSVNSSLAGNEAQVNGSDACRKPEVASSESLQKNEGVSLDEFISQLRGLQRKGLYSLYAQIRSRPLEGTFDMARLRENQCKNRYTDVLCYDHSRVLLKVEHDDPSSDFINGNFVDGYNQKNAFISTQGPLPRTTDDFWRMVFEQEVRVIAMVTQANERGRMKCAQYWPLDEDENVLHGQIYVKNCGTERLPDYIVTKLEIRHESVTRQVYHMQFISWPDYGVPQSALALLSYRDDIRRRQAEATAAMTNWQGHPSGPPIVVHCSAGIGRTGTFITLDISILRLEDCGKIDIKTTVEKIRSQRAFSIQMPDQYVFCYLALLEYALSRGLLQDVDLSGFEDDSDPEEFET